MYKATITIDGVVNVRVSSPDLDRCLKEITHYCNMYIGTTGESFKLEIKRVESTKKPPQSTAK